MHQQTTNTSISQLRQEFKQAIEYGLENPKDTRTIGGTTQFDPKAS